MLLCYKQQTGSPGVFHPCLVESSGFPRQLWLAGGFPLSYSLVQRRAGILQGSSKRRGKTEEGEERSGLIIHFTNGKLLAQHIVCEVYAEEKT